MTATPPRRPQITPTNSLILLLPQPLFAPTLLPLFQAHFESYGELVSWTALEKLGRVFVVYGDEPSATEARREMDGFVWEDEAEQDEKRQAEYQQEADQGIRISVDEADKELRIPLRVFFGPHLSLPLPTLETTLLSVPALSRNFLISPPGSPPVGWEQTLEEAPNSQTLADDPDAEACAGWGDELARALRFLSVSGGGDDDDLAQPVPSRRRPNPLDSDDDDEVEEPTTSVVVAPNGAGEAVRPAVTVSTPAAAAASAPGSDGATPPPGAAKITAVKATIESLLGRKRSFSGLDRPKVELAGEETPRFGGGLLGGAKITPTARPPVAPEHEFVH